MRIAGEATLQAPVDKVWDALLDPSVLVRTIPGCEKLETTGENAYAMTVTAGVAAITGTYSGTCTLTDLRPGESLVLSAQGAGAPGTIGADVKVRFGDNGDGTTRLSYDADAVVGGMIGGVGQRMLSSVSKRMAGEFFGNVDGVLNGSAALVGTTAPVSVGETPSGTAVFTAPRKTSTGSPDDLLKGVLVGAALVLAGVAAGALAGRRRP
jgi:carbon monoxide dehydrogenase subunit G